MMPGFSLGKWARLSTRLLAGQRNGNLVGNKGNKSSLAVGEWALLYHHRMHPRNTFG